MSAQPPHAPDGHPAEAQQKLFDLGDAQGVNESERILTRLCKRSFLRLWSQTNVFTDEGFRDGKAATKELTDALVIFGNDVIVFSDKHVTFQDDRPLDVAWPRWYRRAVLESCNQHQVNAGQREGVSTPEAQRIKELERENRKLRKANEILQLTSPFFAQTEVNRRIKS